MSGTTISMVKCATDTETRDISIDHVLEAIRTGGKRLRRQVELIRRIFKREFSKHGDYKQAKNAIGALKKHLAAVMWSGTFSNRAEPVREKLVQHSSLLQVDLDSLGVRVAEVRKRLQADPHVWALFLSPSGDGLKVIFRVPANASKHGGSFRAAQKLVRELTGSEIDEICKDVGRLCFMSYDPELYVNESAIEIEPLPEPEKPRSAVTRNGGVNLSERQCIAEEVIAKNGSKIIWISKSAGYLEPCPGQHLHTTGDGHRDCKIDLDRVPTTHCFHDHCRAILEAINRELRSRTGKAEYVKSDAEPVEPPLRPTPYIPPPLALLPSQLQEYVHAAAESLTVDVSYILLPLLSSLGAAIGNTRSIILKRGFIQPPIIWTGIIGRSGSRKSPALNAGCFAVMENERHLMRQNKQAREKYENDLAGWEAEGKKKPGKKPEPPVLLTCLMDDMTLAALADAMQENPHGVLAKKDELSHWFAAFDQYHSAKGADVSRWLSLHTGVLFGLDRRTDKRRYRIYYPRVCIAGGIQPKVFRRILTPDYFERGLPARFLLAHPPFLQDRWSDKTVSDDICETVLELFEELWLLPPEPHDGDKRPKLLPLDREAKAVFVDFYNECGAVSVEAGEHEEAAWCKLTGYAARLGLVGQLARDPNVETLTGEVMRAACELARWFGNEATRIYAELAETQEQREQREFCEFIERRGGTVRVRDVITYYRPLKNQREKAEQQLNALVKAGRGQWEPVPTTPRGGQPTRKFRLLHTSASAEPYKLRGKAEGCADADAPNSRKISLSRQPGTEAETLIGDELGVGRL
jgi:hypothetical protein